MGFYFLLVNPMLPCVRLFGLVEVKFCNYLLNDMFSVSLDGFPSTVLRQNWGTYPPWPAVVLSLFESAAGVTSTHEFLDEFLFKRVW